MRGHLGNWHVAHEKKYRSSSSFTLIVDPKSFSTRRHTVGGLVPLLFCSMMVSDGFLFHGVCRARPLLGRLREAGELEQRIARLEAEGHHGGRYEHA